LRTTVDVRINGEHRVETVDNRVTLLDLLREQFDLTGAKKGCDHGQCGACTVLCDGLRVNSCLMLTVMADGRDVTTIEGVASAAGPHPLQAAFVDFDALQCGYCTPGQICSAMGMLNEIEAGWPSAAAADVASPPEFSDGEVRERMSGNLCRCGAYVNIVPAIRRAHEDAR